jgi:hypothetical protein
VKRCHLDQLHVTNRGDRMTIDTRPVAIPGVLTQRGQGQCEPLIQIIPGEESVNNGHITLGVCTQNGTQPGLHLAPGTPVHRPALVAPTWTFP